MLRRILRVFSPSSTLEGMLAYPEGKRIYREFHSLRREQMDQDALKVINRLNRHGHRSYLVGGCVRDMLLGRRPKDFDVVTSATPTQIRKIFSNSRSIGRRFKIVHVIFRGGKVIEVSTFRSLPDHRFEPGKKDDYMLKRDNQYGNPREDAARRDFTINAIFFDPRNESVIDYVGGYDDINNKAIRVIGDADISFKEDPVRMLRAAKFAALLDFNIDPGTLKGIKRNKNEIQKASTARLLEEYNKIFRTGRSFQIFQSLAETGLLKAMLPEAWNASDAGKSDFA
ncbi:MAG: polynucleotide adenylyltransferase PcnB, partial [Leptospiraceae bacterium]|nr:polynucleotide adenylyltransferase PcnB [Leptospiraceae bacterium]